MKNPKETDCLPPFLEPDSTRATQVMVNICHKLNCFNVPPGEYKGTNLEGLGGKPVNSLSLSNLEKVVLLAAFFRRPIEFVRKRSGLLQKSENGAWYICQEDGSEHTIDNTVNSILNTGKDIVAIRINPASYKGRIRPNRPFQKIIEPNDIGLIIENRKIVGIYEDKDEKGQHVSSPYRWQKNDTIELFIEPKAIKIDDIVQAGGFIFQLDSDGIAWESYITTNAVSPRFIHRQNTIDKNLQMYTHGTLANQRTTANPVIRKFIKQDGAALEVLHQAVTDLYPDSIMNIQANYAYTLDGKLVVCAFDMEIPEKIERHWRTFYVLQQLNSLPYYTG